MPRNGSGTYTLPAPPFVAGTVISSATVNDDLSDIASALTASLPRDGQAGMTGQLKATDGSLILPGIAFTNDLNTGLYRPTDDQLAIVVGGVQVGLFTSGGLQGSLPVGLVSDFAGATVPSLWILCYGQNVSRTTYALLFAILGTTYGSGDGATTFGLPDLRGRLIYGKDNMGGAAASRLTTTYFGTDPTVLGNAGGTQTKTLIGSNLPAYTPSGSLSISNGGITVSGGTSGRIVAGDGNNNGGGGGSFSAMSGTPLSLTASQATTTGSFSGSAQGGTSTAFGTLDPGLILNKIIFAGA